MISFGELPEEIQLPIFADIIYSRNFPSSLVHLSQVSIRAKRIAQDDQLWRQAICFYFPFVKTLPAGESFFQDQFRNQPLKLFKLLYQHVCLILKSENLTFGDYAEFLLKETSSVPANKQTVLTGLCLAAGQRKAFSQAQLALAKNHCLLFSAALNNKITFVSTMSEPIATTTEFKRSALLIAAEYGFLTICAYLISHAQAALDRSTLSEAFLKACSAGNCKVVQVFLTQPLVQQITFSLAKALNIASIKGDTDITTELLKNTHLRSNKRALADAIKVAVENEQTGPLNVLLQHAELNKNILLMIEMLQLSVKKKNSKMVAMIMSSAEINFSLIVLSDAITFGLDYNDHETAHIILQNKLWKIPAYARRQLFYKAAEKGALNIVKLLLDKDPKSFNPQNIGQALRLAASHNQEEVVRYLLDNHPQLIPATDRSFVLSIPVISGIQKKQDVDDIVELTKQFASFTVTESILHKENNYLKQFGSVREHVRVIDKKIAEGTSRQILSTSNSY
ncbi:MAG: ankyrin repeat domain-containing protein [Proteobacteria bacterium]|nr:ankyrin repeat domain-containing protein [Pseudomonadota bacterium]